MIRAKVLKPLIYNGKAYKNGEIFDCDDKILRNFESRGIASGIAAKIFDGGNDDEVGEIVPVEGLPSLEEEQKAKAKKK